MSSLSEKFRLDQKLNELTIDWLKVKNAETEFNQKRLSIENQILILTKTDPMQNTSNIIDNGVKVGFKINRKWDNAFVESKLKLLADLGSDKAPFTFVFKEDKKKMEALAIYHKDIYNALLPGLTETAAKPSFSINKPKEVK